MYEDLVGEIMRRGYETFVVGGTVRDVISGTPSNDVDLVTSMPLDRVFPLVRSMYGGPRELKDIARIHGHLRPGGKPGSGDPYIDLCVFKHSFIGTMNAVFSDDFGFDVRNRDFSCNAIYYDPINKALLDPTGMGISDAEENILRLVTDLELRDPRQLARVFIRSIKFMCRGFVPTEECKLQAEQLAQHLASLDSPVRASYIKAQILSKGDEGSYESLFEQFRSMFIEVVEPELWDMFIEPIRKSIL